MGFAVKDVPVQSRTTLENTIGPHLENQSHMTGGNRGSAAGAAELSIRGVAGVIRGQGIVVEMPHIRFDTAVFGGTDTGAGAPAVVGPAQGVIVPHTTDRNDVLGPGLGP